MSYSVDLREKVLKYRAGHTLEKTSKTFEISVSAIRKWEKLQKDQGSLVPKELKRSGRKIKKKELESDVEKHPEDFNWERAVRFKCTEEAIRKAMKRHNLTRKKRV